MESEFINPNWHVVLVHFPLALLICGTLIEFFSFLWPRSTFRMAGRWMILLGALIGIPTVLSGLYALKNVALMGAHRVPHGAPWKELVQISPLSDHQWEMLSDHLEMEIAAMAVAIVTAILWLASSDGWRAKLQLPLVLVLLVSTGLAIAGAWNGGEAVYRHGTGVQFSKTASHAPTTAAAPTSEVASTAPTSTAAIGAATEPAPEPRYMELIRFYTPPIQIHVILAGVAVALALAALALAIRRITQGSPMPQVDHIAAALGGPQTLLGGDAPDTVVTDPEMLTAARLPVATFWLLAFLVALLTGGVGYFMLATGAKTWIANDLWNGFIKDYHRREAHVLTGGGIVLLTLILAALARWAPKQRTMLTLFSLLLVLAIAFQIWVGILLLYDTSRGPLTGFN